MTKQQKVSQIRKRDGKIVDFVQSKVLSAIEKALKAVDENTDKSENLSAQVIESLNKKFHYRSIPAVEELQDVVESVLIKNNEIKTAKAYILYRDQHKKMRDMVGMINSSDLMESYLGRTDWRLKENSNMSFSVQGLNNYIASTISAHYWLNKIYPPEIQEANTNGDMHIHDLGFLAPYCCGWDIKDLLIKGFGGVPEKVQSKPPKHFRTALGQAVNFFYTLQGESAGAQAFSNFDTYLAPFIRYDNLSYEKVKQCIQEFLFNMNVPTRIGFQFPFTNITLDLTPSGAVAKEHVIISGKIMKETYSDFQPEMDMFNKAYAEVMLEGDATGRVFPFPIPTYSIDKDFDWENENYKPIWEMTAKYGIPYFSNYVNSDMSKDDVRSMCCRLRLDNRELRSRGGGLFGANPLTGSIGVVTLNMSRIGYLAKDKDDYKKRVVVLMDLAKESLEIKRKLLEKFTQEGLYPYSKYYLSAIHQRFGEYWKNHFNTIGLNGFNESCKNFLGKGIETKEGNAFAEEILEFMKDRLLKYQKDTDQLYNLEATPAEGTTYRFAKKDKELYPEIIVANEDVYNSEGADPYYTNSTHLPVGYTEDIFEALELQDNLQTKYTGGTVLHGFLGEKMPSANATKNLVKKITTNFKLPYITITPTFSICPKHGYLPGEQEYCSKCDEEIGYVKGSVEIESEELIG